MTLGFQPPLKQWVDLQPPLLNPKGFNHRNWVNLFCNGGGSPGVRNVFGTFCKHRTRKSRSVKLCGQLSFEVPQLSGSN